MQHAMSTSAGMSRMTERPQVLAVILMLGNNRFHLGKLGAWLSILLASLKQTIVSRLENKDQSRLDRETPTTQKVLPGGILMLIYVLLCRPTCASPSRHQFSRFLRQRLSLFHQQTVVCVLSLNICGNTHSLHGSHCRYYFLVYFV